MGLNVQTRGSSNSNTNSALVVRQIDPKLYRLYADTAPFVAMMRQMTHSRAGMGGGKKMNIKNAIGSKFEWVEKDPGTPYALAQAAYNSSDTAIVVDN